MKDVTFFLTTRNTFTKTPTIENYGFSQENPFSHKEAVCILSFSRELEITEAKKTKGIAIKEIQEKRQFYISIPIQSEEVFCFRTKLIQEWMYILVASGVTIIPPVHSMYVPVLYLPKDRFYPKEKVFQDITL